MRPLVLALLCAGLACGPQNAPPALPATLLPAPLPQVASAEPELPRLRVRFYAGKAYRARVPNWEDDLSEIVAGASGLLRESIGVGLLRVDTLDWKHAGGDLQKSLQNLRSLDPGKESDLVVALIDAPEGQETRFAELVAYDLLGKHVALRSFNQLADSEAISAEVELSEAQQDALLARRRQHKQAVVLAHGIAGLLGAPESQGAFVNGVNYSKDTKAIDPSVGDLLKRTALAYREGSDADETWRKLAATLQAQGARAELVAAAQGRADGIAAPKAVSDVSSLRPDDQAQLEEARNLLAGGKAESAWVILEKLLELYPEHAVLVNEACVTAYRRGGSDVITRCERALALDTGASMTRVALARALTKSDAGRARTLLAEAEALMTKPGADADRQSFNQLAFAYQDLSMPRAVARMARDHEKLSHWAEDMQRRYGTSVGVEAHREGEYLEAVQAGLKLVYANQIAKADEVAAALRTNFPDAIGSDLLLCERDARRRRFDTAASACEAVIAKHAGNSWAHYLLGSIRHRQKKNDAAKAEWRAAIDLDPRLKVAYEALGKLYRLTKDQRLAELQTLFKERFGGEL